MTMLDGGGAAGHQTTCAACGAMLDTSGIGYARCPICGVGFSSPLIVGGKTPVADLGHQPPSLAAHASELFKPIPPGKTGAII